MNIKTVFAVGTVTTVQTGNSFDTSGYQEHAKCTIVQVRVSEFGTAYLIEFQDEKGGLHLGQAGLARTDEGCTPIMGTLYCTNARRISDEWTRERAVRSLGFAAE